MFTVTVGFEGSGKRRMRIPFARRYSVMPSTEVTRSTPCGNAAGVCAAQAGRRERRRNRVTNQARFMGTSGFRNYAPSRMIFSPCSKRNTAEIFLLQEELKADPDFILHLHSPARHLHGLNTEYGLSELVLALHMDQSVLCASDFKGN